MKNILTIVFSAAFLCILLFSCEDVLSPEDNINVVYYSEKTVAKTEFLAEETVTVIEHDNIDETTTVTETVAELSDETVVYISPSGKKYHIIKTCAGKNAIETTLDEIADTKDACKKCVK